MANRRKFGVLATSETEPRKRVRQAPPEPFSESIEEYRREMTRNFDEFFRAVEKILKPVDNVNRWWEDHH